MSEGEATATLEESAVESEKVKAINGMKEVEEVKLQNGESEKPQINGDMEKGEEDLDSGEQQNGREEGGFEDTPKQKLNASVERTQEHTEEVDGGKNGEKMGVDEEKDDGEGKKFDKVDDKSDSAVVEKDVVQKGDKKEDSVVEKAEKDGDKSGGKEEKEDKSSDNEKKVEKKEDEKRKDEDKSKDDDKSKDGVKDRKDESSAEKTKKDDKDKSKESEKTPTKDSSESNNNNNSTTKVKERKSKSNDDIQEIPVTRQLRARKTPKKYTEDDDDIKITNEVIKDDSSDIEMIEESDPLAISDADVKKIQKEKKEVTIKAKDPNVIIIDTNTLLKNQGNLAAAVAQSNTTGSSTVQTIHPRSTTTSSNTVSNMSIQNAIQAITGGVPAQGLQSAYITALQQVLLSQGGQVPMNSQHLAQLQQYYNSLGHLQDDAYVIEAPSFIVPYVMEGKPKEPIKEFLKRINKELEEHDKKGKAAAEKEKRDRERLERRKKREEERQKRLAAGEEVEEQAESEDDEEKKKEEEKKEKDKKEGEEKKEGDEEKKKDGKEAETKDKEGKESEDKEKGSDAEKAGKESDTDTKDNTANSVKSDTETKEDSDEGKDAKKDKDSKKDEKVTKTEEKGKKDEPEVVDDDDKENKDKDKSDSDSVVDLEKESKAEEEKGEDLSYLGKWEPYYRSALGKFMVELGLNQAQEFLQSDLLRMQKRKLEKMKTHPSREGIMGMKLLEKQLEVTRQKNAHLQVPLRICKFCTFKTESEMVMERHLESPHMVNYTYKCNFCDFETRGPQIILFHMEAEHNVRGRLERAPAFFQCSLCPYEDNNKSKMTRHSFSCAKKYKPERNCELLDWEPPAKIPKIHRGRPNTLGKAFEPVKMPNLLPKNMQGMNLNLQGSTIISSQAANAALAAGRGRGRPVGSYKNVVPMSNQGRGVNTVNSGSLLYTNRGTGTNTSVQGSGSQQFTLGNQMFHLVNGHLVPMSSGSGSSVSSVSISSQSGGRVQRILPSSNTSSSSSSTNPVSLIPGLGASSSITIQPSISITPLPRSGQQPSQGGGGKGSSSVLRGGDSGGKPSFVICEICDGYIKDLEQLRNHMNLIHKVKIHPKMIYNRPPLNCQKCQHRFFTDQGLERHLLGTHGLVTSSMQEAANKGKDAGRCPICGKVFQWKLLNHVSRDHKMTLKPAHLSYKCTVCTATFNMYRLFENHVYSAHSVVNKNKGEGGKKGGGSSDSPLKINDEITIIPQPATGKTKSSSSSSEKTISKKSEGTPTMSKEITITKVGSRPTRRSGGSSVEVISLDESPKKSSSNNSSPGSTDSKKRVNKDSLGNSSKKSKTSS